MTGIFTSIKSFILRVTKLHSCVTATSRDFVDSLSYSSIHYLTVLKSGSFNYYSDLRHEQATPYQNRPPTL